MKDAKKMHVIGTLNVFPLKDIGGVPVGQKRRNPLNFILNKSWLRL